MLEVIDYETARETCESIRNGAGGWPATLPTFPTNNVKN